MTLADLATDLTKFALTGLVSFAASAYYTEYQLQPKHNVSVIPLSIETLDSCDVAPAKVDDRLSRLAAQPGPSKSQDYNSYLQALSQSRPPSGRWIVQRRLVPETLLPQLETDGIFNCASRDKENHPDPRYNTFLVLQAAVVMDRPGVYLLKRSCSLLYGDEKIPLSAFAEAIELRPLGGSAVTAQPEALTVRETNNLILQYDTRDADSIKQTTFASLVNSKETVELSIKCTVVHAVAGDIQIGGERAYRIKAPLSLR